MKDMVNLNPLKSKLYGALFIIGEEINWDNQIHSSKHVHKDTATKMFIAALCITGKHWQFIHVTDFYTVVKMNKL
jgi:hypothetical protein